MCFFADFIEIMEKYFENIPTTSPGDSYSLGFERDGSGKTVSYKNRA